MQYLINEVNEDEKDEEILTCDMGTIETWVARIV